jgi:chromosome segregation ATPase
MKRSTQDRKKRLAQLQEKLAQLKAALPEHCSGRKEYTDAHHATAAHWQKIEDLEEELKALEAEPGD